MARRIMTEKEQRATYMWKRRPVPHGPLYRYVNDQAFDDLMTCGGLRLNDPAAFHDTLALGHQRGDDSDGVAHLRNTPGQTYRGQVELPPIAKMVVQAGRGFVFEDCTFQVKVESEPVWIYCTSGTRSSSLLKQFESTHLIEIKKPFEFFALIASSLREECLIDDARFLLFPCMYTEKSIISDDGTIDTPPWAMKKIEHAHQDEWRAVLPRSEQSIRTGGMSVRIVVPEVAPLIREITPSD